MGPLPQHMVIEVPAEQPSAQGLVPETSGGAEEPAVRRPPDADLSEVNPDNTKEKLETPAAAAQKQEAEGGLLLVSTEVTWGIEEILRPLVLFGCFTFTFLIANHQALGQIGKNFVESPSESTLVAWVSAAFCAIWWHGCLIVRQWVTWCGLRGDRSQRATHIFMSFTTVVVLLELGMTRKTGNVLFGLVAIIVGGSIATWIAGGPRKKFALVGIWMLGLFQGGAFVVARFAPPVLAKLPPQLAALVFPGLALFYESGFMPLIFLFWSKPMRGQAPDILLPYLVATVRYVSEGLFLGGLMNIVGKNADDAVPRMCGYSILCRCFSKFLGRIGFWDMLRGRCFGSSSNGMTLKRDLIGRVSTTQAWMMSLLSVFLLFNYGIFTCHAAAHGVVGSPHLGGVLHRPILWVVLAVASVAALCSEFGVAVFVWKQNGGSESGMSVWQTFRSMHKPGMQSLIGEGRSYNEAGCMPVSTEQMVGLLPCAPWLNTMSLLLMTLVYMPLQLSPLPTQLNLMGGG